MLSGLNLLESYIIRHGIHMFVQLWNLFHQDLKATKQNIIYTNVMEDAFLKKKKL